MSKIEGLHGQHKANEAQRRWREKWYKEHLGLTHKEYARIRRQKRMKRREERLAKRKAR